MIKPFAPIATLTDRLIGVADVNIAGGKVYCSMPARTAGIFTVKNKITKFYKKMKALSLIAIVFAAFLIFLGISSRKSAGNTLGNAVIIGGAIIAVFVAVIWAIIFIKEKRRK